MRALLGPATGQFRTPLPSGVDIVASSVNAPPVVVEPDPLLPEYVARRPLFRAVVAASELLDVRLGSFRYQWRGINVRSWPALDAPIVGVAQNGNHVDVYQTGIPQSGGRCPRCQWWYIFGGYDYSGIPSTPPGELERPIQVPIAIGFVRAIGPQGEWNLRRVG